MSARTLGEAAVNTAAGLTPFRDPRSVAVVGASSDTNKWGFWLARGALRGQHRRAVYLVNRTGETVLDQPTYRRLADLPEVPDLVAVCVPAAAAVDIIDEGLSLGVRGFLSVTSGIHDEMDIARLVRASGARLVGPNSLGIFDAAHDLELAWGDFEGGDLAVVTQSGQVGSEITRIAARAGLGISRFISVGNQADVTAIEILADLVGDENSKVVALYLESFAQGRALVEAVRALRQAGKRVLVLAAGASDASTRLARSHTGSMTAKVDVVDAACHAAGALHVQTPTQLVGIARTILHSGSLGGRRVAIVSDSGGQGAIGADVAAAHGLDIPEFSKTLQEQIAKLLPSSAASSNPVDLAGAGEQDLFTYATVTDTVLRSGEVDAVLLSGYFGCYSEDVPLTAETELAVADRMRANANASDAALVVHLMTENSPTAQRLREGGVPTHLSVETAAASLAGAANLAAHPGRDLPSPTTRAGRHQAGYWGARDLANDLGIATPRALRLTGASDLTNVESALKFPVVLKAGWLEHKSDLGGVRVGIATPVELTEAFAEMSARLGHGEYVVEEQDTRPGAVEMIVGGHVDPDFGPLVTVGAGGVEAELHRDIRIELAPVDESTALAMIETLKCRPVLAGWRGKPATDVRDLARIVVAVSEAIASQTNLSAIELNPVRVAADGCVAVDALAIPSTGADRQ